MLRCERPSASEGASSSLRGRGTPCRPSPRSTWRASRRSSRCCVAASTASRSTTSTRRTRRRSPPWSSNDLRGSTETSYRADHTQRLPPGGRGHRRLRGRPRQRRPLHQRSQCRRGGVHEERHRGAQPRHPVVGALYLRPGDVVVLTELEHHANIVPGTSSPSGPASSALDPARRGRPVLVTSASSTRCSTAPRCWRSVP